MNPKTPQALPEYHRMLRTVAKQYCHMRTVLRQLGVIAAPLKTASREWFCYAEFRWAVSMVMMRQTQVPVSAEALEAAVKKNPSAAAAGVAGTPAEAAANAAATAAAEAAAAASSAAAGDAVAGDAGGGDAAAGSADASAVPAADASTAAAAAAPVRQVMALIPFIDMFNHEEGPITSTFGGGSNVMEVTAKRNFKAGEQRPLPVSFHSLLLPPPCCSPLPAAPPSLLLPPPCCSPLPAAPPSLLLPHPCCSPLPAAPPSLLLPPPCCSPLPAAPPSLLLPPPCCSPLPAAPPSLLLPPPCCSPLPAAPPSLLPRTPCCPALPAALTPPRPPFTANDCLSLSACPSLPACHSCFCPSLSVFAPPCSAPSVSTPLLSAPPCLSLPLICPPTAYHWSCHPPTHSTIRRYAKWQEVSMYLALLKWLELPPSTHLDLFWTGKPSPELATWLRVATTTDEAQITEDLRGAIAARAKETAELLEAHGKDKATTNGHAEPTSKPASSADVTLTKAQADLLSSICQRKLQELQAGATAASPAPAGLGLGGGLDTRSAGAKACEKELQLARQLREAEEGALSKALEMCGLVSA
ncbi:unnamed protein product [Closterium sp. NIES-65]|nr:unnamed protein product [Closterium sp. NIES-65]